MAIQTYRTDDLDTWYEYYSRLDSQGPYHQPQYLALLERYFGHIDMAAELFIYEEHDDFVYYPYLIRPVDTAPVATKTDLETSRYSDIVSSWYYGGPLLSPESDPDIIDRFREAFSEYCQETGIVAEFVRYDPNLKNQETFDVMDSEFNRETVPVDLTQSKETIWEQFEKRNRNAIRQAQDSEIVVEQTNNPEEYQAFHDIYSNAMDAKDASEHYRFEADFFLELLSDPDRASLFVARDDGNVVGGSIIVHDKRIAHDYIRASNPDYWPQRVNNLLCYGALIQMQETGRDLFDFQGGRPGVFRFKKAFSSERREFYIGKEIHLNGIYDQLLNAATEMGIDTEKDYFPAYRNKQSN